MSLVNTLSAATSERAEQRRRDADALVDRQARSAQLELELQAARNDAARAERLAAEQARAEQEHARAVRRDATRARRAAWRQARTATVLRLADRGVWIGPILMPMAVAWVGQIQFAMQVLGWPLWAGIVFAAAFELSTVYVARLDYLARQDGDSGLIFRLATWVFALVAAAMNYAHAAGEGLAPTGAAVAYGLMSLAGIALWELLSLYRHRRHLRATGRMPAALPRFGLNRWLNFPATTWMARRLAIRDGHATVVAAWQASVAYWAQRRAAMAATKAAKAGHASPVVPADAEDISVAVEAGMPDPVVQVAPPASASDVDAGVRVDDADKAQPDASAAPAPEYTPQKAPKKAAKKKAPRAVKANVPTRVLAALEANPGATQARIADIAGTSPRSVRRVLSAQRDEQTGQGPTGREAVAAAA